MKVILLAVIVSMLVPIISNADGDEHVPSSPSAIRVENATLSEACSQIFSKFSGDRSQRLEGFVVLDRPQKSIVSLSVPGETPLEKIVQYLADGTSMHYFVKNRIVYFYNSIDDRIYLPFSSPILTSQPDYKASRTVSAEWVSEILRRHNINSPVEVEVYRGGMTISGSHDSLACVEALDIILRKGVILAPAAHEKVSDKSPSIETENSPSTPRQPPESPASANPGSAPK